MAEENQKRHRGKNFSSSEQLAITNGFKANSDILHAKHSNGASGVTKKMQDALWNEICDGVNAVGYCQRTTSEVKEKWRNMTKRAKSEVTAQRISSQKTGGGPPIPPMSPLTSEIAGMFSTSASFHGIPGAENAETIILQVDANIHDVPLILSQPVENEVQQLLDGHNEQTQGGSLEDTIVHHQDKVPEVTQSAESTVTVVKQQENHLSGQKQQRPKRSLKELQIDFYEASIQNEVKKSRIMDQQLLLYKQQTEAFQKITSVLDI